MTIVEVVDQSEVVVPKIGWFAEMVGSHRVIGRKLFFTDPDPYKTYHEEDEPLDNDLD